MANIDKVTKKAVNTWLSSKSDNQVVGSRRNPVGKLLADFGVNVDSFDDLSRNSRCPNWLLQFAQQVTEGSVEVLKVSRANKILATV